MARQITKEEQEAMYAAFGRMMAVNSVRPAREIAFEMWEAAIQFAAGRFGDELREAIAASIEDKESPRHRHGGAEDGACLGCIACIVDGIRKGTHG